MTKSTGVSTRPPKPVSAEVRERAVRLVAEQQQAHATQSAAFRSIAEQIGCSPETLWLWVRRAERDAGQRPGVTTNERAWLTALEREHRELKRANEILRKTSAFFAAAELDRSTQCPMPSCTPSSMRIGRTTGSSRSAECWRSHRRPTTCTVNARPMRRATWRGTSVTPCCRPTLPASTATTMRSMACARSGSNCSVTARVWRAAPWRA